MPRPVINPNVSVDYAALTLAQLREEAEHLAAVSELCQTQRKQILETAERRKALAAAEARVAEMSELQKDALREALGSG